MISGNGERRIRRRSRSGGHREGGESSAPDWWTPTRRYWCWFQCVAKGNVQDDAFDAVVEAPRVDVSRAKAAADPVSVKVRLNGKERTLDASLKIGRGGRLDQVAEDWRTLAQFRCEARCGCDQGHAHDAGQCSMDGQSLQFRKTRRRLNLGVAQTPTKVAQIASQWRVGSDKLKEAFVPI